MSSGPFWVFKSVSGKVAMTEFTTFGLGKGGTAVFEEAMREAQSAILRAGLDDTTRIALLDQLLNNRAGIRLIGDQFTRFTPGVMEEIGKRTGMIVGEGFRVLR